MVNLTTISSRDLGGCFPLPGLGVEVSLHGGGTMGYALTLRIRGGEGDFVQPGS